MSAISSSITAQKILRNKNLDPILSHTLLSARHFFTRSREISRFFFPFLWASLVLFKGSILNASGLDVVLSMFFLLLTITPIVLRVKIPFLDHFKGRMIAAQSKFCLQLLDCFNGIASHVEFYTCILGRIRLGKEESRPQSCPRQPLRGWRLGYGNIISCSSFCISRHNNVVL